MKISPNEGGCWFCNDDNPENMCSSLEWDCNVHDKCAQEQAALGNPEALIMLREWGEITNEEMHDRLPPDEYGHRRSGGD